MLHVHATCIDIAGAGLLLRGRAGVGKSDLGLRMIAAGAVLVADDQVVLSVRDGVLWAAPPPALRGLIEVRGIGVVRYPWRTASPVALVVDLVEPDRVPRMPEPACAAYLGVKVPLLALAPFQASAPAKVRLALDLARGAGLWPALVQSCGTAAWARA